MAEPAVAAEPTRAAELAAIAKPARAAEPAAIAEPDLLAGARLLPGDGPTGHPIHSTGAAIAATGKARPSPSAPLRRIPGRDVVAGSPDRPPCPAAPGSGRPPARPAGRRVRTRMRRPPGEARTPRGPRGPRPRCPRRARGPPIAAVGLRVPRPAAGLMGPPRPRVALSLAVRTPPPRPRAGLSRAGRLAARRIAPGPRAHQVRARPALIALHRYRCRPGPGARR